MPKCEVKYKTEQFLNPKTSMSTGSVVCVEAEITEDSGVKSDQLFLEIADCRNKVRLHMIDDLETKEDFIQKLELLQSNIQNFIIHLKK